MQANNIYLATSPTEAKNFDTGELRNRFLIGTIFNSDHITAYYTTYDRFLVERTTCIKPLTLEAIDDLRADYFWNAENWVS